jgi:hypothetical protein
MKLIISTLIALLSTGAFLSAQMPGMATMQRASASQGTTLGANTTSGAAGIALGNRVVMRGYVDFQFQHKDDEGNPTGGDNEEFVSTADIDFLFDFSPVTAEVHLETDGENVVMEQAFGRYSLNRDFNISFGRQLTALGYESDEQVGLNSVSKAYRMGLGRNYVDGVRANFNNGQFGLSVGLHDDYFEGAPTDTLTGDHIAIDIAASMMIIPGLEAQLGYANQDMGSAKDWSQFNAWIAYNPNDLTLAFEYDNADKGSDDYWSMLLLANYQFNNVFGATIKYSHENEEDGGSDNEADRFTFALLFTLTQNLMFNAEYSRSSVEVGNNDHDIDEFYLEALLTF